MICWSRAEMMPDTGRTISDEEDEELQELMRQMTYDGLAPDEFTPADQSCKPETAVSLAVTPQKPESYVQVLSINQLYYQATWPSNKANKNEHTHTHK